MRTLRRIAADWWLAVLIGVATVGLFAFGSFGRVTALILGGIVLAAGMSAYIRYWGSARGDGTVAPVTETTAAGERPSQVDSRVHEITTFSLEVHEGPYESWPAKSKLLADGAWTGERVPGCSIERQYTCDRHYLLVTSYDCPFEESQNFLLLDSRFRVVAKRFLGAPYDTFVLMDARPTGDRTIELVFAGDSTWYLEIRPPSSWHGPRLSLRRVVRTV